MSEGGSFKASQSLKSIYRAKTLNKKGQQAFRVLSGLPDLICIAYNVHRQIRERLGICMSEPTGMPTGLYTGSILYAV